MKLDCMELLDPNLYRNQRVSGDKVPMELFS